jgi:hypothetical protein
MSINDMIKHSKERIETKIGAFCHKCYTLLAPKEELLHPYKVHKIIVPIKKFNTDSRLIQIHNHLVEKPWRILTQYAYISRQTPYISLYLISPIHRKLSQYDEICHMTFVQPEEVLHDLKGKYNSIKNF